MVISVVHERSAVTDVHKVFAMVSVQMSVAGGDADQRGESVGAGVGRLQHQAAFRGHRYVAGS